MIFFISTILAGFKDSWKKLKELASKSHKSKNKATDFLGYEKSEYPGVNQAYLKVNEDKWSEYYQCLQDQYEHLGKYMTVAPEAILGFEGNNQRIECKICISPLNMKLADNIQWKWVPKDKKYFEPIDVSENIVISPEDKTLHLYNLQLENSGQYMCTLGDSLSTPYFLTVIKAVETEMRAVHSPNSPKGPFPENPASIPGRNLVLDTEWSEWSTCSTCDEVGKRHKLGYCAIYMKSFEEPELTDVQNGTVDEVDIFSLDLELFVIFKYGIPCHSHLLPKVFKDLPEVGARKNEIMTGFCREKCPENVVFEVRDKDGNILERANNSGGIYSMMQPLPPLEPPVQRKLQYEPKGKSITIQCPGSLNIDSPIQWQVGDKNLVPELISKQSNGRIFVSITEKIHIKNARISDSNIYSCWQHKELVGTIRIVVEKKIQLNFLQHVMLFGIVVILGVFLWVFAKAFAGRHYAET